MHAEGHIRRWDADKGFGFIQSAQSTHVFFHIRDYKASTPPQIGQRVSFAEIHVGGKGPRAMEVRPLAQPMGSTVQATPPAPRPSPARSGAATHSRPSARAQAMQPGRRHTRTPSQATPPAGAALAYLLMLGWLVLLGWAAGTHRLPMWLLGALAILNVATFCAYAWDKHSARQGQWRTPEQQLHLLALAGGWPAAWWAQQWLRHKSRKTEFRSLYWGTVLLHCALLGLLLFHPKGQGLLQFLPTRLT